MLAKVRLSTRYSSQKPKTDARPQDLVPSMPKAQAARAPADALQGWTVKQLRLPNLVGIFDARHTDGVDLAQVEVVGQAERVAALWQALDGWPEGTAECQKSLGTRLLPLTVPSKGRARSSELLAEAHQADLVTLVAIEADELPAYRKAFPNLVYALLPLKSPGLGYAREVLRSVAAGAFCDASTRGTPVHMFDDNISFVTNHPLKPGRWSQAKEDLLRVPLAEAMAFLQHVALTCSDFANDVGAVAVIGLVQNGSNGGRPDTNYFGKLETYACYKAILLHVPRTQQVEVGYIPGLHWPEDIALLHALKLRGLTALKTQWPVRFAKSPQKSMAAVAYRFALADLLRPWRPPLMLSKLELRVLRDILLRCWARRDDELETVEGVAALLELDWRRLAVEENVVTPAEVAAGPLYALIKVLQQQGEGWAACAALLRGPLPADLDQPFLAACLRPHAEELTRRLVADPGPALRELDAICKLLAADRVAKRKHSDNEDIDEGEVVVV